MYDKSKRTWSQRLKITKTEKAQSTTSSVTTSPSSPTPNPTLPSKVKTTASSAFANNEQINACHDATTRYQNLMAMHSPALQLKQFSDYQSSLVRGGSISGDPLRGLNAGGMSYEYLPNAISRSIKYSEPWIYGTVRGIPARPYHHYQQVASYGHPHAAAIFAPSHALTSSEAVAVVICSCPEYLNGTKRDLKKASICKKCKGSRLPLATMGGTMRVATTSGGLIPANKVRSSGAATMRLVTVSKKARPSILDPQKDPYDLMRRTRLLSPEPGSVGVASTVKDKSRSRGKSESPVRGRSRTRAQAPLKSTDNVVTSSDSQDCWLIEDTETLLNAATPSTPSFGTSRRSILRCNVNPYDLISINTPQSSAPQKSTSRNSHIRTSITEKNYRGRLGSSHNEFMAPNDDFNVGDAALADEAPPFATSNASNASSNDRGIAVTAQAMDCNDAVATAKFKYNTKDEVNTNSNQNNYKNVQAIAGKRISLGERKTIKQSLIQQNDDSFSYENIIVDEAVMLSSANIQVHSEYESMDETTTSKEISKQNVLHTANTKYAKPQRPPRTRKQDSVNSNTDVADTDTDAESEKPNTKTNDEKKLILQIVSHTETVTAGVTPTQQIKSILKRPSTRSPDITLTVNSCLPTSFEKNISDNDNFNQEKHSNATIDEGNATSVTLSPLLTKSQFYIPLPQSRKKVQFMVEDKVYLQSESEQPSRKGEDIDDTVVNSNDYEGFSTLQSTCKYEYYSKKQAQRKQKSDQIQNDKVASISSDNENQTQEDSSAIEESLKSHALYSEKLMTTKTAEISNSSKAQLETSGTHVEDDDSEEKYFDDDETLTLTLVNLKNSDSTGILYEDVVPFADPEQHVQQQHQQPENKTSKSNNTFVEAMSELAADTTNLKTDVSAGEIITKTNDSIITAKEKILSAKKTTIEKEEIVTGIVTSKSNQANQSRNPIRRAHSERQLSTASNKPGSTNERNNNRNNPTRRNRSNSSSEQSNRSNNGNNLNFKDTTALRFKNNRAVLDSRELFTHAASSTPLNSRPREPPPPPPPLSPPPTDVLTTEVTPAIGQVESDTIKEKTSSTTLTKSKKKKLKESNHLHLVPTGSMQHNIISPRVDALDEDSIHADKNAVTAEMKYKRTDKGLSNHSKSAPSGLDNEQHKQHHHKQKGKQSNQQKKQQQQEQHEGKSQTYNNIQNGVANKSNDSFGSEPSVTEDTQRRSNKNSLSNQQHQQHQQDNQSIETTTNQAITLVTKKGSKVESTPLRRHQQQQSQQQRTVVRVAPFNSVATEVHRLKISHNDADLHKPSLASFTSSSNGQNHQSAHANEWEEVCAQKKTSILINGDDCYSTMNISSDASTPLYQSSVVVADYTSLAENSTNKSFASMYAGLKMTTTSNTVTINVSSPRTSEEEIIYQNNKINSILSRQALTDKTDLASGAMLGGRAVIPIRETTEINLQRSASSTSSTSTSSMTSNSSASGSSCGGSLPKRGRTLIKLDYEKEKNLQLRQSEIEHPQPQETIIEEEAHNLELMSHEEELMKILRNPVEAVKRNLVPHVCGRQESSSEQDNARKKKMKDGNKDVSIVVQNTDSRATTTSIDSSLLRPKFKSGENSPFIMKLLEDPMLSQVADGLETETIAELIENSLKRLKESRNTIDISGTKDSEEMNRLINISLEKIKEERQFSASNTTINVNTFSKSNSSLTVPTKEEDRHSNRGSISSANSFASANNYEMFDFDANESDCYQSCSSEITTAGDDDAASSVATRSKFYQMLVDATLAEIEMSTNVEEDENDHHYESIRNNGDPIYEEISDIPPPLPLSAPPLNDPDLEKKTARSIFEGASKYDILSYLVDAKERGLVREESFEYPTNCTNPIIIEEEASDTLSDLAKRKQLKDMSSRASILSDSSEDTLSNMSSLSPPPNNFICGRSTVLQRKGGSNDIERNDSGVGSETSKCSRNKYQSTLDAAKTSILNENIIHVCEDCEGPVETQRTETGAMFAPLVCRKCGKKRVERKEIITEIVETEEKYGRDLQIILEEFCHPMLVAGLLTQEQLSAIFLNTEELLENNQTLAERMRDGLDIALEQGDDDLLTVNIGKIFLDFTQMLHAFERYCVRQAGASLLLANLEKEKELLRIFLKVSQMENAVLRRMNLNSFLMVPVQRVTKYPLLLARLYKVTPLHLEGRDLLKQAQEKIELHLNHINQEAKDVPTKLWRRISSSSPNRRASCEIDMINIKLRKMAIDILEWNHDEVRFAMEGKLLYTQPTDNNWKKARTIKLTPVNALLVTNGKPSANYKAEKVMPDKLNFPKHTGIREASLLVVKEKCGRYTLLREPLYLDRCIVCSEADWDDYFEVQEISSKDTFIFKAEDSVRTKQWYTQLQYHAQGMGAWRKRRNALANIMINGMLARS